MATSRLTRQVDPRIWQGGLALLVTALGLYWLMQWWTYPPAVEFDNLKYIQLLRTAVSSERPEWVAKVREAVDQRVAAGEMSKQERAHFDRIFELAGANKWEEAHRVCFDFETAQLGRRRAAPAPEESAHRHAHQH